jgi:hypothetical protein
MVSALRRPISPQSLDLRRLTKKRYGLDVTNWLDAKPSSLSSDGILQRAIAGSNLRNRSQAKSSASVMRSSTIQLWVSSLTVASRNP